MRTIFHSEELPEQALFSPADTTKGVDGSEEIYVSTFSENVFVKNNIVPFCCWPMSRKV